MNRSLIACALWTAAVAGSCGDPTPQGAVCQANLLPGDLVVSEIFADPPAPGTDDGREWIELYNATDAEIALTGVQLIASKADGTGSKTHVIAALKIPARGYVVLGDAADAARPAWVDYSYGNDLGSLPNTGGAVSVRCGTTVVDQATYREATAGESRAFDGAQAPDAIANDNPDRWCDAVSVFDSASGAKGTPRLPNDKCAGGTPGNCKDPDTGMSRAPVGPTTGQLVISEVMSNPAKGTGVDTAKAEYIEITATADVDLNGISVGSGTDATKLVAVTELQQASDCIHLKAGEHAVLAGSPTDMTANGGIAPGPRVFGKGTLTLSNSGGTLAVGYASAIVDAVTYPADATGGASWSLDPAHTDATQNDDKANWCRATTAYGTGGKGTPGADNDSCNVVVPGMCTDSGTGSMRAVVAPAAGDIVINEAMPDPAKVTDAAGEWFELKINRAVDLNGLQLGKDAASATELKSAQCLAVTAGSYALFAHSTDAATNGGLPALPASQTFTFGMSNAPGSLYVGYGGAQLDTMSWTTSTQGKSIQRDPADATKVCSAAAQYNGTDFGTPGAANVCQ